MEPTNPDPGAEERRREAMDIAQKQIDRGDGRSFFSGYGYRRALAFSALAGLLPAYAAWRLFPWSHSKNGSMVAAVIVMACVVIPLSVWLTVWVRKKPDSSKWHYFLG